MLVKQLFTIQHHILMSEFLFESECLFGPMIIGKGSWSSRSLSVVSCVCIHCLSGKVRAPECTFADLVHIFMTNVFPGGGVLF